MIAYWGGGGCVCDFGSGKPALKPGGPTCGNVDKTAKKRKKKLPRLLTIAHYQAKSTNVDATMTAVVLLLQMRWAMEYLSNACYYPARDR